jgi:Ca2+-binding EF-hand superfamily protein
LVDFKLDLEDEDITALFKSFDTNGDGVLQMEEFMDMILGQLSSSRRSAVEQAWSVLDVNGRGSVLYNKVRDTFDGKKHPDVCNGRKTEEAAISDFLEVY